jgi:hypothetical protein
MMPIHRIFEEKRTVARIHKASEVPQIVYGDSPCCKVPRRLEVVGVACR